MKQLLLLFVSFCLVACSQEQPRERTSFNNDWQFALTDSLMDASASNFDDNDWRNLNLPHDWSIESDFSDAYPATPGGGALPGGMGWYRKTFKLPLSDQYKSIYIDFDGVYRNSKVWINGHLLGFRPNGYISFRYDLTPYLNFGENTNLIVVQVDNTKQPNSRWYSGSGIYRNVWLVKTGKVHVDLWGIGIETPVVNEAMAEVVVKTTLRNTLSEEVHVQLLTSIKDPQGKKVASVSHDTLLAASSTGTINQTLIVEKPELWTTTDPRLYNLVSEVKANHKKSDLYETSFGLRTFSWDAKTGFYLNGEPTKILGVCLHHDLGCLGTAVNTRAIERQLQIMKDMGVNAIRTSHNPPAPELLTLCDEMGLLVQDESFDMWRRRKSPFDYAQYFDEWHERDLTDQLLRDRNHPSVFMWSIGNEVLEQWAQADADTLSLEAANLILNAGHAIDESLLQDTAMSVQGLIAHSLAAIVKRYDTIRPVTAGNNETSPGNMIFKSNALDVLGFNYHEQDFATFPDKFPGKTLLVSESTSALMTRGYYQMPSDSMYIWPEAWWKRFERPEHLCSSYDNCHVPWGSTHERTWYEVKRLPHVSGLFLWTGFDYLGEPTPYWWPSRSSFFGVVDLAGLPKDVYYMYQSEWTDKPVLHVFPHWNWKEGELVDIWAYYNNADEVELLLNGKSIGSKTKTDSTFHVSWRVPFTPGTLQAVSRKNGQVVMTKEIQTAGKPAQMRLIPDRSRIQADGTDLSFITVEIVDKEGNLVPDADQLICFDIKGAGFIAGTDNGDPNDPNGLKRKDRHAFYGKAMAVVQSTGQPGSITLIASAKGLPQAEVIIQAK